MVDVVSVQKRSEMMAGIKGKDTKPELIIRKGLFARGLRYRKHNKQVHGKPDLVFKSRNAVIFVNGCYWHGHHDCHLFRYPKSKTDFWKEKIGRNIERDKRNIALLAEEGWRVAVVWECALKGKHKLDICAVLDDLEVFLKVGDKQFLEIRSTYRDDYVATIPDNAESLH